MDRALRKQIDAVFADVDTVHSPGCALGIVQDGKLIYTRGYGMANLECDAPIGSESIFHVASVSKQFTCLAILLLVHEGLLGLDDDVRLYLPELPDYGDVITIRHLAHHVSGLRDQWDLLWLAGWREDDVKTNADMFYLASRQKALNFQPGEAYLYCNTGYTLMALIVERLSGHTFRAFTHARIFDPLGMHHTHFHDDHTELVFGRTSAYKPRDEGGFSVSIPMFDTVGATSLFTTVEDLARWANNFETGTVGGQVLDLMHQQGVLNNGERIAYAFGQTVDTYRGLKRVQHSGSDAGYRSHFARFPDQRMAVIVLSNLSSSNPGDRVGRIVDVYYEDALEPLSKVSNNSVALPLVVVPVATQDYVGRYYGDEVETAYEILAAGDGLLMRHHKHGNFSLTALGDDRFDAGRMSLVFDRHNGAVRGFYASTGRALRVWFER